MSDKNKIEKLFYCILVILFIAMGIYSNYKMKSLIL